VAADYYAADTENGDHADDPSEDGLFMLLEDLTQDGNTFRTITPADEDPAWYASVTLLPVGTFEVERADPAHGEHHRDTASNPDTIARDLTIWLAARDYPNRPIRRSGPDFLNRPRRQRAHDRWRITRWRQRVLSRDHGKDGTDIGRHRSARRAATLPCRQRSRQAGTRHPEAPLDG